jgi:hypothetical protein
MKQTAPIIVGGTGGSGTRVVQSILQKAGIFMGKNLNGSGDAEELFTYTNNTIPNILTHTKSINYNLLDLPLDFAFNRLKRLGEVLNNHTKDINSDAIAWGWKNPRSIYLLPLCVKLHPDCYFIHVVRDGRDMAISDNQNQYNDYHKLIFPSANVPINNDSISINKTDLDKIGSAQLWNHVNGKTYDYGTQKLGENYQVVRYEDLCARPGITIRSMFDKLDFEIEDTKILKQLVKPSSSTGRYKQLEPELLSKISVAAAEGLKTFNYA